MPAVVSPEHLAHAHLLRGCWQPTGVPRTWFALELITVAPIRNLIAPLPCCRSWTAFSCRSRARSRPFRIRWNDSWRWAVDMGFRFSLETVLRLRQSLEDSERLRLQALLANRAQLERALGETASSRRAVGNQLKTSLRQEAVSAAELHFAVQRLAACDLQTARLNASLNALHQQIERQQEGCFAAVLITRYWSSYARAN